MNSPIFKDNIEDKEIKFMLPEDKDIVVNKVSVGEGNSGR